MTRIVVVSIDREFGLYHGSSKKRLQESDLILGSIRQIEDIKRICSQSVTSYL
ncbi:Uncharacterised protein [Fusobacterium necrophorum subsp. necrophorum]|nr:Uncharacterised protein [Fusobacterium necrophorum subsp. necrophorum]